MRWRTTELLVVSLLAGVPSGAGQGTPSTPTASRLARPALAASPTPPSAGDPAAAPSAEREAPSLGERWLFNARERTQRGLGSLEESRIEEAASAFDAAARLRPGDPMTAFNAGTGRLAAGLPEAVSLLEKAARSAPVGLAPQAWYNLGAARLKAGDGAGAVEAYKEALRREPGFADAKHNLELALQQLEQQKKEQERAAEGKKEQQEKQDKNGDDRERSEQENSAPETSPEKDRRGRGRESPPA